MMKVMSMSVHSRMIFVVSSSFCITMVKSSSSSYSQDAVYTFLDCPLARNPSIFRIRSPSMSGAKSVKVPFSEFFTKYLFVRSFVAILLLEF